MPILNAIERSSRAPAWDAPVLLSSALREACAAHYDPERHVFHYARFAQSPAFEALELAARALADFDCASLRIGLRLAFWLNVYNALVLHAVVARDARDGVRALGDFFSGSQYVIGGHVLCLDEIEHGLLRVNAPRPGLAGKPLRRDDPRLELAPYLFDERVHFAMYSACRSSPAPAAYRAEGLGESLERATCGYLARHVRLGADGATLVVPKQFEWYAADFGGARSVFEFVAARLQGEAELQAVARLELALRLRYAEFDWTLNAA